MQQPNVDLETLTAIVRDVAQQELVSRFTRSTATIKQDGSVVTEADIASQTALRQRLTKHWPNVALIGEETPDQERETLLAQHSAALWCVDPLDGTTNFACGIPFFALSLALLVERRPVLGVVYDPLRNECFYAAKGRGAWLNGHALRTTEPALPLSKGVGVIDFKRLDKALASRLATDPPFSSQRSFGSVVLDWCWLAANRFHVYLHGKQKVWDYVAGWLILEEAGGASCTLDGEAVYTPAMTPRSALAARSAEQLAQWRKWIADTSTP